MQGRRRSPPEVPRVQKVARKRPAGGKTGRTDEKPPEKIGQARKKKLATGACYTNCAGGLTVGCDFSGAETPIWAMLLQGIEMRHLFSCDKDKVSRKISAYLGAELIQSNVENRCIQQMPSVDLYCFSPPCQPFSSSGCGNGIADPRGTLIAYALEFIKTKKPKE